MKKYLVLIDSLFYQYGLDESEEDGILFLPMMKHTLSNKIIRAVRKLHMSSFFPLKKIWLYDWFKHIDNYDTVILADAGNTYNVAKYIHRNWPDKRIIIWYRNSVSAAVIKPEKVDRNVCELWSFDEDDCGRYNMKFNPQFYMRNRRYTENTKEYDAFFVGQDKGRMEILKDMQTTFEEIGIRYKFCIVGVNSERLSYDEILDYISRSKIIVDCQCQWQHGITLRPLEALFYQKKLITNSSKIKNEMFYNDSDIYIWGNDNHDTLLDFVKKPFIEFDSRVMHQYDVTGWVERFN